MAIPFSVASAAYGQTQRLVPDAKGLLNPSSLTSAAGQGPDFGQLVSQSIEGLVEAGKTSDTLSTDFINGNANIVDVVTAVSQTELAIDSLVAIRDRVISAYEEIMRMPI
ncbi:MAG: flagellar hook-basal body complex protein FliE [Alphaproteobacteria bacterium]|nr:flagellar hook-basal body complex protein FliE [Alphaproteobacteria bacterium]